MSRALWTGLYQDAAEQLSYLDPDSWKLKTAQPKVELTYWDPVPSADMAQGKEF